MIRGNYRDEYIGIFEHRNLNEFGGFFACKDLFLTLVSYRC